MPAKASKTDISGLGYRLSADRPISECFAQVVEPDRKYDVLAPVADARGIVPVRSGCLVLGRTTGTTERAKLICINSCTPTPGYPSAGAIARARDPRLKFLVLLTGNRLYLSGTGVMTDNQAYLDGL